jgi:O-antigen ligase
MLFFALGGLILHTKSHLIYRLLSGAAWCIVATGLLFSYTRAAWISVFISTAVLIFTLLKIRFRYILIAGLLTAFYFSGQRSSIVHKMQRHRQKSETALTRQLQSISNISTDESNLERLNRWNSALRMFREKPVMGWGPGTYKFKYAPFQRSSEKSAISTDLGNLGNAHSEYIGPLAESGLLGSISFILIGFFSLLTGFRVYKRLHDPGLKQLVLGIILGFITYLVHGTLNNFLDTDKASALFWGFIAVFVSLDIYNQDEVPESPVSKELDTQH